MAKEEKQIWIFKSKREMMVSIILFIIFIIGFIVLGTKDYSTSNSESSKAGTLAEYEMIPEDNVFVSLNASEAYTKLRYKDVIFLFGASNNEYVGYYAKLINEAAKENGIYEVYYYDITEDREENNATYEAIVNYLEDNLIYVDTNDADIYAPLLLVKKDGIITYFNESNAIREGKYTTEEYWNNYTSNGNKEELNEVFKNFNKQEEVTE